MGRYEVHTSPQQGYTGIVLGPPENRMTLYVPAPRHGEQIDSALVTSVLEQIVTQCNLDAQVKDEHIMMRARGGGRHHPSTILGMPDGKDVRNALVRAGYRKE